MNGGPRLVAPLFGLGCLFLTSIIGRRLWPNTGAHLIAPFLMLGSLFWGLYTDPHHVRFAAVFLDIGGSDWIDRRLARPPVAGMDVIRGRNWSRGVEQRSGHFGVPLASRTPGASLDGRNLSLVAWLVCGPSRKHCTGSDFRTPLGRFRQDWLGGEEYRNAIFWGQSAGRVVNAFDHGKPVWWYLPFLPIVLLPWLLWPSLLAVIWDGLRGSIAPLRNDAGDSADIGLDHCGALDLVSDQRKTSSLFVAHNSRGEFVRCRTNHERSHRSV